MKTFYKLILLFSTLGLISCGKTPQADSQMVNKYTLQAFDDIDNPSTLDLDKLKNVPRVIDLKNIMTSVKQQDDRGTCSFFASIALVESAIKKKMNVEVNLSEEFLNNMVKTKGYKAHKEAGSPIQNLQAAISKNAGFLLERDWPYQPTWFAQKAPCKKYSADDSSAPAECFSHNSPDEKVLTKKIPSDNFDLLTFEADSTNEIITTLAEFKEPMSVILPVNMKGWADNGNISYDEEMRKECIETPGTCGNHVVVLTGYDLDKKVFFFKNSWGKEWGQEGYGTIPFDMVDRHVWHTFALVELKKSIILPIDHDKDNLQFKEFKISSKQNSDGSLHVNAIGDIGEVGYHTIKVGLTLVQEDATDFGQPSDINTKPFQLSNEDAQKYNFSYVTDGHIFFPETEVSSLSWTAEAPLTLQIAPDVLQASPVAALINDFNSRAFMRTTLYVYSDDSSFKVLKRIFLPITQVTK